MGGRMKIWMVCLVLDYIVTCHTHYNDVLLCV